MLSLHKVTCSFQGVCVLDGLSLEIPKGEIVGLMGASGSGKSTLLRCIQGFETPESGVIRCQGRLGLMMQDFQLFPHMTVWDNIVYVPLHVLRMERALAFEKAQTLLESLGLGLKKEDKPHQLSGGQKQRVALIRALAAQPDLLLCDEPTSALDTGTIQDLCALFRHVAKMGITMLMVSHDLGFLTQVTQRLLVLHKGTIGAEIHAHQGKYKPQDLEALQNVLHARSEG